MDFSTARELEALLRRASDFVGREVYRGAHIYDGPYEVHKSALARTILEQYGIELGSQGS